MLAQMKRCWFNICSIQLSRFSFFISTSLEFMILLRAFRTSVVALESAVVPFFVLLVVKCVFLLVRPL